MRRSPVCPIIADPAEILVVGAFREPTAREIAEEVVRLRGVLARIADGCASPAAVARAELYAGREREVGGAL